MCMIVKYLTLSETILLLLLFFSIFFPPSSLHTTRIGHIFYEIMYCTFVLHYGSNLTSQQLLVSTPDQNVTALSPMNAIINPQPPTPTPIITKSTIMTKKTVDSFCDNLHREKSIITSSCSSSSIPKRVYKRRTQKKMVMRRQRAVRAVIRTTKRAIEYGAEVFLVILPQRGKRPKGFITKGFCSPAVDEKDVYGSVKVLEASTEGVGSIHEEAKLLHRTQQLFAHRMKRKRKYQKKIRAEFENEDVVYDDDDDDDDGYDVYDGE